MSVITIVGESSFIFSFSELGLGNKVSLGWVHIWGVKIFLQSN
jgi:hypothetical protein